MNLASNCRYPNEYDRVDLCGPWDESQRPVLPRSLNRCCQRSSMLQAIRLSFNMTMIQTHCAKDTIKLLQQETPDLIGPDLWPPNSPHLNPVDYKVWGVVKQRVYTVNVVIVVRTASMSWSSASLKSGTVCSRTLLTQPSTSGESDRECVRACVHCRWTTFWKFIVSAYEWVSE